MITCYFHYTIVLILTPKKILTGLVGINVKPWNLIVTYTNLSVKTETMGGCMKIISRPADGKKKEQNEFKTQMYWQKGCQIDVQ